MLGYLNKDDLTKEMLKDGKLPGEKILCSNDWFKMDEEGCLLIVHASFGSVWRLSPFAEPLHRIVSCTGRSTTNIAFGGSDRRSLFITEAETGSILRAELPAPGQALYSHSD